MGGYVCEQLSGANSSPIVTKLRQSYPWPQGQGDYILEGHGRCALLNAFLVFAVLTCAVCVLDLVSCAFYVLLFVVVELGWATGL